MSKDREEARAKSRKARRSGQKGAETERDIAALFQTVPGWETVKRRPRYRFGPKQNDLIDEITGWCSEIKNRAGLPSAFLEKALGQAADYAETRHGVSRPVVICVDGGTKGGRGHSRPIRVYYDFAIWLEEQKELQRLRGEHGSGQNERDARRDSDAGEAD